MTKTLDCNFKGNKIVFTMRPQGQDRNMLVVNIVMDDGARAGVIERDTAVTMLKSMGPVIALTGPSITEYEVELEDSKIVICTFLGDYTDRTLELMSEYIEQMFELDSRLR